MGMPLGYTEFNLWTPVNLKTLLSDLNKELEATHLGKAGTEAIHRGRSTSTIVVVTVAGNITIVVEPLFETASLLSQGFGRDGAYNSLKATTTAEIGDLLPGRYPYTVIMEEFDRFCEVFKRAFRLGSNRTSA